MQVSSVIVDITVATLLLSTTFKALNHDLFLPTCFEYIISRKILDWHQYSITSSIIQNFKCL